MSSASPRLTVAAMRVLDDAVRRASATSSATSSVTSSAASASPSAGPMRDAALLVVTEMRPHLTNLMGNAGFRALQLRALALTEARLPWVGEVRVKPDGALDGLDTLEATVGPADFREGNIALLAQLLALLAVFVGEPLTIRLMRDIWPDLSLADRDSGNGDNR